MSTPRTIEHNTAGPAVLILTLPTATRIIVNTAPAATTTVVSLTAAAGDEAAQAAVDSATITAEGRHVRIKTSHTPTPAPASISGVNIQGSTVVAGNIGGSGNIGMVTSTHHATRISGSGALVAHASVPQGSIVRVSADHAEVAISGQLASVEAVTSGVVAIDLTSDTGKAL